MTRSLALLLCAGLLGCFGRNPAGEFKLDAPSVENADFPNALFQTVGVALKPGNKIDLVDNGRLFDVAIEEIGKARRSVHIDSFIWSEGKVSDRLIDAIARRTRAGVQCRVIVDAVGSPSFGGLEKRLQEIGCEVHRFRPIPGQDDVARDHRKLILVDGRVGFTGGFGIDDKWDGNGKSDDPPEWRDSNVRVQGPAVADMQQSFSENWQEATGALLPVDAFPKLADQGATWAAFVSSSENSVATRNDRMMQLLIATAKKRLWIANAYFVPSTPIMTLLTRKAREGVDVRVLAAGDKTDTKPYLPTQRARMDELAQAGVRTYEYVPTMLHSKTIVVDDSIVVVGSSNLEPLSLNKLDDGVLVAVDQRLAREQARRFLDDLARSNERGGETRKTAGR